jgi:histidinol-phosphate aminotransferase
MTDHFDERPPFTPILQAMPPMVPFTAPEALERIAGRPIVLRLGANESAFGISERARETMQEAVGRVHHYCDPECGELRQALATFHGVSPKSITVGAGIDDLLGLAVRAFLAPGETAVATLGTYATFRYHVLGYGGVLHTEPYRDGYHPIEALAAAVWQNDARILYLPNPDNPSGTWLTVDEIESLRFAMPPDCLLLLDEAYVEFAPPNDVLPVNVTDAGTIRLRTFSKVHGMAGARIGYAIAHEETAAAFEKIRLHFGVNLIAQAGALASLKDPEFVRGVVRQVAEGREEVAALALRLGFHPLPSATNFVTMDVGSKERADRILELLLKKGVFIRKPTAPPLDRCIRITVGKAEERAQLAAILEQVVDE